MASDVKDADEEIDHKIDSWVRTLLLRGGFKTINFSAIDDAQRAYGILNMPGKYVVIVDAMHQAMHALARGEPLPEFQPLPPANKPGAKRKR